MGPIDAKQLLQRGIAAAKAGDRAGAHALLRQVVEVRPDAAVVWMWLAAVSDNLEEQVRCLRKSYSLDPASQEARKALRARLTQLAQEASNGGDRPKTRGLLQELLALEPQDENLWYWLALMTDAPADATKALQRVLEINPENRRALALLKKFAPEHQRSQWRCMLCEATSATGSDECPRCHAILAFDMPARILFNTELDVQRLSRAVERFKDRLKEDATDASAHVHIALAYLNLLLIPDALVHLWAATELMPEDMALQRNLDALVRDRQMLNAAPSRIKPSLIDPDTPAASSKTLPKKQNLAGKTRVTGAADAKSAPTGVLGASPKSEASAAKTESAASKSETIAAKPEPVVAKSEPSVAKSEAEVVKQEAADGKSEAASMPGNGSAPESASAGARTEPSTKPTPAVVPGPVVGVVHGTTLPTADEVLLEARALAERPFAPASSILPGLTSAAAGGSATAKTSLPDVPPPVASAVPRKVILAVDDSPTVLKHVSQILGRHGLEVVTASDAVEALALLVKMKVHLVLTDITMPHMDGYQFCKLIKRNPLTKDMPVIMLSGKDGFFDKVRGRLAGAAGYVSKPFKPAELTALIEKYSKA